MKKRMLAMLLALVMLLGLMPMGVFADDGATGTEPEAPKSITITIDYPYTLDSTFPRALAGVSYVVKPGDQMQLRALDENGKETPVTWSLESNAGGTLDENGVFTVANTNNSYVKAVSKLNPSVQSDPEKNMIPLTGYVIGNFYKDQTVTLSSDGQSDVNIATRGGIAGSTVWSYTISGENVATLKTDLTQKGNELAFAALRPGTIQASFTLDLDGEGTGKELTDSALMTIVGISVEDAAGNLKQTKLTKTAETPAPTVQLKATSSLEEAAFTWSSGDETVATVDQTGLVTAKGAGSVIISATDGTYTGGIQVVVADQSKPTFEKLDFLTTSRYQKGLLNTSWRTNMFQAAKTEYTGLTMTNSSADTLTIRSSTVYDTELYTAEASYVNVDGEDVTLSVASGADTNLTGLPFGTNTISIALMSKSDPELKTVYTFSVTRPWSTSKVILSVSAAGNGLVFQPEGRELTTAEVDGKTEGKIYRANSDGTLAQYVGTYSTCYYYRIYAMNGLEQFSLTAKGADAYSHLRFSTDGGETWQYLGQTGASGQSTGKLSFPAASGEENPIVTVLLQILDDKTYSANQAAGKDGFAEATPNTYTIWVEQLPKPEVHCDMETATTDSGDWYPAFDPERTDYKLVVAPDAVAPTLTYTVSAGAVVTIGDTTQTPNADGSYSLTLTTEAQKIQITASDGSIQRTYSFSYSPRDPESAATRVVDYLPINSQYTNGNNNGYGIAPYLTLTGGNVRSLGNFGGYITFYLEDGLTDDPANPYGVDFYVDGNAFVDTTTSGGLASMEPGQVWVSEDGETWYALAGSEHYEDSTRWDYSVTYTREGADGVSWVDSDGQTNVTAGHRTFSWPSKDIYPWNTLIDNDTLTLTGVLIPCVDGTTTGKDNFASTTKGVLFGYVDAMPNGTNNPYLENSKHTNTSSGFDLAWAVDASGIPVDVSGKSFHYVKVVTASHLQGGAVNEKSTEVSRIVRAEAAEDAVGVTTAPTGVTITAGSKEHTVSFREEQQVYSLDVGSAGYVSVLVNGTDAEDNIYVNNQRMTSGTAATGIKVSGEKLVRILVQNGQREPVIYLLKLTGTPKTELIDGVKLTVLGAEELATTADGIHYSASVNYRVSSIAISVDAPDAAVTINGQDVRESYALEEGENTFTIQATQDSMTQTVTLTVTREKAPETTGKIKVRFSLLGDDKHGKYYHRHTLAAGDLTVWMSEAEYELDAPATVIDLIELALEGKYTIENPGGNYISAIGDLGEFDNGKNSGWMYTVNGTHPGVGVAARLLEDGDVVVLHYTDDYTYEEDGVNFGKPAEEPSVIRLAGANRYETALKIAEELKAELNADKFDTMILACGSNFADALAGSYLAAAKNAPVLLSYGGTSEKYAHLDTDNMDYIRANLAENGTVYILGGEKAVPALYEEGLEGLNVQRLKGANRFETNRKILQEVGVPEGSEILVCDSREFADSLSASATGKPILLVTEYNEKQYGVDDDFLKSLSGCSFTIIGGTKAVSQELEETLRGYGEVDRVAGSNRLETSVQVAQRYFPEADSAVVAYGWDFPDGLCGGVLAYAQKAPLILTMGKYESIAKDYLSGEGIATGNVLGGLGVLSDKIVTEVFSLKGK